MSTKVKLFSASSVEGLEKAVNKWFDQCDEDADFSFVIDQMQMGTYPGASTGLCVLYTKSPASEEAQAEEDQALLQRLLERGGRAVITRPAPIEMKRAKPGHFVPDAGPSAQERIAQRDAEAEATRKECGCYADEMCRKCDSGTPLDPALAVMVKGLPEGADTSAAARTVGADEEALEVFRTNNPGATPVE